jgi:hypothetical protein
MIAEKNMVEFDGDLYDARHGGPFDRGSADSYYGRERSPHYFEGATYSSVKIVPQDIQVEFWQYLAGYEYNERFGDKKVWD